MRSFLSNSRRLCVMRTTQSISSFTISRLDSNNDSTPLRPHRDDCDDKMSDWGRYGPSRIQANYLICTWWTSSAGMALNCYAIWWWYYCSKDLKTPYTKHGSLWVSCTECACTFMEPYDFEIPEHNIPLWYSCTLLNLFDKHRTEHREEQAFRSESA